MRTIAYIDGLNLFYRALKGTEFKWLDVAALVRRQLPPDCHLSQIKYFSALVRGDSEGRIAQEIYLNALRDLQNVTVSEGYYIEKNVTGKMREADARLMTVRTFEEKCTDVDLAIAIVVDVMKDRCDCVAVISNDGDLRGALRFARERGKKVLLMPPVGNVNKNLYDEQKDLLRRFTPGDFRKSQLPPRVGKHSKPRHWGGSENE